MTERVTIDVPSLFGGWGTPWPNVAEIETVLTHERWTLVGGLMTQLHAINAGIGVVRPTNDVDIVLHVETTRGVASEAAAALESLGYEFAPSIDPRAETAHRFRRGAATVDIVTSAGDVVDVLVADHAAPRARQKLHGRDMVAIDGGTQALRRTLNAALEIIVGATTTVSVPSPFGALILKAAAFQTDSRDPERHLQDAVVFLCCIEDPYVERERFAGSDRPRLDVFRRALPDSAREWSRVASDHRRNGQAALRLLTN